MKAIKAYGMAMAVAAMGAMASCGSDEELTGGNGEVAESAKAITTTISTEESSVAQTRNGLYHYDNKGTLTVKASYFGDDVVWVYSPGEKYFNKLVPIFSDGQGVTETSFTSEENAKVDFESGETVLVVYAGDKSVDPTSDDSSPFSKATDTWTLKRDDVKDMDMVLIHGSKDSIPYYDGKNPFVLNAAYGKINANGELRKYSTDTQVGAINLTSYMPYLRFSMPASVNITYNSTETDVTLASDDITNILSKLEYKMIIDAVPDGNDATSGFPQSMTFTRKTDEIKYQDCFTRGTATLGNSLRLWYKPVASATNTTTEGGTEGTSTSGKSEDCSWLWHTEETHTNYDGRTKYTENGKDKTTGKSLVKGSPDAYKGYVYIPVPPVKYKLVRIRVRVSLPEGATSLEGSSNYLGIYEYKKGSSDGSSTDVMDFSTLEEDSKLNNVYDLGSIWSTSSSSAKGLSDAPATVVAGEGWTKVADDDTDEWKF